MASEHARGPGDEGAVQVRFTKWGGERHWEFALEPLGRDEHGWWGGAAVGTRVTRPDRSFDSENDWVVLVPYDKPWSASFYAAPQRIEVYVDMTTLPVWDGSVVSMVDLDLDVVLFRDGTLFIDDEDEFAQHQVELGYPPEVVAMARRTADELLAAVRDRTEPFGNVGRYWLARFGQP